MNSKERNADVGDAQQLLGIADQPEQVRPDEGARDDVAQRRA
jgi:hypothetical protein